MTILIKVYSLIQVIFHLNLVFQSYCYECFEKECNLVVNNDSNFLSSDLRLDDERFDHIKINYERISELPQLSRVVRKAEKIDDFLEDSVREPS